MPDEPDFPKLSALFSIHPDVLRRWRRDGVRLTDAREIIRKIWRSRTPAAPWKPLLDEMIAASSEGSTESLRRRKLKAESERIEFANAVQRGDYYARTDVDEASLQSGSAFKLALMEARASLPPQLAGLDEAGVDRVLDGAFRELLTSMSDLDSALWEQVRANCAKMSGDAK